MKDLRIRTKLATGIGAIVALFLILLALSYGNFERQAEASRWDRHSRDVLRETDLIATAVLQIQNSTRGFMLTGNESLVQIIPREEQALRKHWERAVALTRDRPVQQARLQKLWPLADSWVRNVIHPLLDKRRELNKKVGVTQQVATAADVLNGAKVIAEVRQVLADFSAEENRLLAQRAAESDRLREMQRWLLSGGSVLAAVLALAIATLLMRALLTPLSLLTDAVTRVGSGAEATRVRIVSGDELGLVGQAFNRMMQTLEETRQREQAQAADLKAKVDALLAVVSKAAAGDLTGRVTVTGDDATGKLGQGLATMVDNLRKLLTGVQQAGIQVTTSATEIAASANQQEATGIEQAQTSVEVLSTTKEIAANAQQLLKTMEDATAVADYTTSATGEAQDNLRRMDQTMQNMVAATDSISAKLAALSEKAANINGVLATITKVADQTNILSLNAAIEAEKAGEAGRGFSVVATEIRRLADQTSVSTWDIDQMLKEMQSAVSASVMGMDKFTEEIRRSVDEVRQVTGQLSGVMDQVRKLAPQFELVLQGMQSQAVGAQQIAETMSQLSQASQQTVESLRSTGEAVRQLQQAAQGLQSGVAGFSVNAR